MTIQGREKAADYLGILRPEEKHNVKFPRFSFAFYIPNLELKKLAARNANEHKHQPKPGQSCQKAKKGVA